MVTEKTIELPCFGIVVDLVTGSASGETFTGGGIRSDLKKDCDESDEDRDYCAAVDGLESLILALACAGVDIETPAFIEAVERAVEGITNNL